MSILNSSSLKKNVISKKWRRRDREREVVGGIWEVVWPLLLAFESCSITTFEERWFGYLQLSIWKWQNNPPKTIRDSSTTLNRPFGVAKSILKVIVNGLANTRAKLRVATLIIIGGWFGHPQMLNWGGSTTPQSPKVVTESDVLMLTQTYAHMSKFD